METSQQADTFSPIGFYVITQMFLFNRLLILFMWPNGELFANCIFSMKFTERDKIVIISPWKDGHREGNTMQFVRVVEVSISLLDLGDLFFSRQVCR